MAKWDPTAGPSLRRHNRFRGENGIAFCSLIVSLSAPNVGNYRKRQRSGGSAGEIQVCCLVLVNAIASEGIYMLKTCIRKKHKSHI